MKIKIDSWKNSNPYDIRKVTRVFLVELGHFRATRHAEQVTGDVVDKGPELRVVHDAGGHIAILEEQLE